MTKVTYIVKRVFLCKYISCEPESMEKITFSIIAPNTAVFTLLTHMITSKIKHYKNQLSLSLLANFFGIGNGPRRDKTCLLGFDKAKLKPVSSATDTS